MKTEVQVSIVQFATEWLELDKNIERMKSFVQDEVKTGAELIVFPELANIGYVSPVMMGDPIELEGTSYTEFAARYIRLAEPIPGPTTEALSELTRKHGLYIVVGLAQQHPVVPRTIYNSAVLLGPRGVIGVHHKMHLPLNEKNFFYPGNTSDVFKTDLGTIGMQICYDGRFPEITRILALKGAEIICSPWATPAGFSGREGFVPDMDSLKHRTYVRAQENGVFFISSNRSGWQGKAQFFGHSVIAAPNGAILAASETMDEDVIRAKLTEEALINYRSSLTIFRDRRPELYGLICKPLSEPFKTPGAAQSEGTPASSVSIDS